MKNNDGSASDRAHFIGALNATVNDFSGACENREVPISVVAANYNNSRFLSSFLWSLVYGTVRPKEIIVVDDGSTDGSVDILRKLESCIENLQVIYFEVNKGFANALNAGIEAATCKYIARIDPDDICGYRRLEIQYHKLETDKLDVVGSNAFIFDSDSHGLITKTNFPLGHAAIKNRMLQGEHGVLHPTVTGLASFFRATKYQQSVVPAEDYDIFSRMLKQGALFDNIKEPLLYYRVHSQSASTNLKYSLIKNTFDLRDHLFHTKTSFFTKVQYFFYIRSYRNFLYTKNKLLRFFWGILASVMSPSRLVNRIKQVMRGLWPC